MARFNDDQKVIDAFAPHLPPGEKVEHYAYGVKQPNLGLMVLLLLIGILPGLIIVTILTHDYIVALTERRFVVLRFSGGGKFNVKEVREYPLEQLRGVKTSKGPIFTHIKVDDPAKPFVAKFHRMGMKQNKPHAEAIADALQQRSIAA